MMQTSKKKLALHWQILLGMAFGVLFGWLLLQLPGMADPLSADSKVTGAQSLVSRWVKPFGTVFINLLKMMAVPLIISSLIKGVTDLKDISKLSTIGGRTLAFYISTTMLAVSVGLLLVNILEPGAAVSEATRNSFLEQYGGGLKASLETAQQQSNQSPLQMLVDLVPENITKAMTDNKLMLQVIFFVVFLGVALISLPQEKAKPVIDFFDGLNEAVLKMIEIIMYVAPIGVFALMASMVVEAPSADIFKALGWYALTVILGLLAVLAIHALLVWLFARRSPMQFLRGIAPAQLVAFSTSSSAATLPITMKCTQENLGVDEEVASFCLPVGATVNMDGTSLYQAVATVFIAQVFGNDLTLGAQLSIILTATLASIGSAAVPGAGMLMLVVVLESVGVDSKGIAIIMAIDRPLDMCRTVVNVTGDMMVSTIIARSLGKLHDPKEAEAS